jgi:hypothetical protein
MRLLDGDEHHRLHGEAGSAHRAHVPRRLDVVSELRDRARELLGGGVLRALQVDDATLLEVVGVDSRLARHAELLPEQRQLGLSPTEQQLVRDLVQHDRPAHASHRQPVVVGQHGLADHRVEQDLVREFAFLRSTVDAVGNVAELLLEAMRLENGGVERLADGECVVLHRLVVHSPQVCRRTSQRLQARCAGTRKGVVLLRAHVPLNPH